MMAINTILVPIKQLRKSKKNARVISDKAIQEVAKSIQQYGFNVPILINSDKEIIAGHVRLEALKKIGVKDVACVEVKNLTEEEQDKLRVLDNAIRESSEWDDKKLALEMRYIKDLADDNSWTVFTSFFEEGQLDAYLNITLGKTRKDVTEKDLDKNEKDIKKRFTKVKESKNDREVTCPNCGRTFKARIYDK